MSDATVMHVCIADRKGIQKHEVGSAQFLPNHGVDGDAHAAACHRQISLLSQADIEFMRAKGLQLEPGAFGENLVVSGLGTSELGVGSRLHVGPAMLELTQVGKEETVREEID